MVESLFDDTHFGRSQNAISNPPPRLHRHRHMVICKFTIFHCEHSLVQFRVKHTSLGIVLLQMESRKHLIHNFSCQDLPLHISRKHVAQLLQIISFERFLFVCIFERKPNRVSDLQQIFGEFSDRELLLLFDHLAIALDGLLIFSNLLRVFNSKYGHFLLAFFDCVLSFFELLFHRLDFCLLLLEECFNLFYIVFR